MMMVLVVMVRVGGRMMVLVVMVRVGWDDDGVGGDGESGWG